MKRWMTKKLGTIVLSTATGLGFFSAGAVLGQDPNAQGNELQRRLGQLMSRQTRPQDAERAARRKQLIESPEFQRASLAERMQLLAALESAYPSAQPAGQEKPRIPLARLGIQAPVSGSTPKVTSANVAGLKPVIKPAGPQADAEPAAPRPAIRSNPETASDAKSLFAMPVISPREAVPQTQGHPLATPKSQGEPQFPPSAHALAGQELLPEHAFEMPWTRESAPEESVPATEESAPEPVDYPVAEASENEPQFEMPFETATANQFEAEEPKTPMKVVILSRAPADQPAPATAGLPYPAETNLGPGGKNPFADVEQTAHVKPEAELKAKPALHDAPLAWEALVLGLDGFCPVTLRDDRQLAKGSFEYASVWEGVRYEFASSEAKTQFDANPELYAPVQAGCDVIGLSGAGQRQTGSLDHACWYRQRLYLFQSAAAKRTFSADPGKYAQ